MKEFRSLEDVEKAGLPDEVYRVVYDWLHELIECYAADGFVFDPDNDGHIVLVEEGDTDDAIRSAIGGSTLLDAPLEGCSYQGTCFFTCVMFNNQLGVCIVAPDSSWLDPAVRARLVSELGGEVIE